MEQHSTSRWTPFALAVIVLVGVAPTARQAEQGLGFVNLEIIMRQTPGYQEALATFEVEFQLANDDFQAMVEQRDSLLADYERTSVVLSPTARQGKESEIQQLQARIEQRAQDLQNRQVERNRELMEPLEQRVRTIIDGVRAERNLGVILDMATMQGIVAIDQALDLTPLIVQRLQQSQN